jgi:hypothetical protein
MGAGSVLFRRAQSLLLTTIVLAVLSNGCGKGGGIERLPIRGTIARLNGEKVSGTITFIPAEGRKGPAATATVKNGNYAFDSTNGPTAGPHRVVVDRAPAKDTILASKGAKQPAEATTATDSPTQWTLFVDLPTNRSHRCDFTVEP